MKERKMGLFDRVFSIKRAVAKNAAVKVHQLSDEEGMRLIDHGNELEAVGRIDEAMQCYKTASRQAPNLARAHLNRGNIFLIKGDTDAALEAYRTAVEKSPDYAAAHFNLGNAHLQSGGVELALAAYERAIKLRPDFADAYVALGCAQEDLGKLEEAVASYRRALEIRPDYAEVHYNLGNALSLLGLLDDALVSYRRALGINPDYVQALSGLTSALLGSGKSDELVETIREVLERSPDSAAAHNNLGVALKAAGDLDNAIEHHCKALALQPDFVDAHHHLGLCYQHLGRLDEAMACYRRALEIDPGAIDSYTDLGNALMSLERPEEAVAIFERAVAIKPQLAEAHYNLGTAFNRIGRLDAAAASFRKAVEIMPSFANAHNNLGVSLKCLGHLDDALVSYRRALELAPNLFQSHSNLGLVLQDLGHLEEAVTCFHRALEINPDFAEAEVNLAIAYSSLGQLDKALSCVRRAMVLAPDNITAHSVLLFLQNYLNDVPASELLAEAKRFGEAVVRKATHTHAIWHNTPDPDRCLRIGLVSGDFRSHPVGFFVEGVLRAIKSSASQRLKLFAYSSAFQQDSLTDRIKSCCDSWYSMVGISDEIVCDKIRDDGIDILIDLSGHTLNGRLPLFAWKPSPVQVSWLGYFATTGVAAIDYLIADPWTLPVSQENNFTEKIVRLPETRLCFTPPDADVDVSPLPALDRGYVTFGCFNNLTKMNDQVVTLWSRVLKAVPNSRLFLMSHQLNAEVVRRQTVERFVANGIDDNRLVLRGFSPRAEYLAAYGQVDIALDPFPYCGGTTTVEALWMGVPVLTLAGEHFLSRQGVGLLMNSGLAEWVATDYEDYVSRAILHASDLRQLTLLRSGLRKQVLASPIFDSPRFACHFEAALRDMWRNWCRLQLG